MRRGEHDGAELVAKRCIENKITPSSEKRPYLVVFITL